jgi:acetylornithine deacetylase/succinyl-diaminopimelate desuccinylase-like protein
MTRNNESITAVLADLIRLDTSNPPGNEEAAVHYIEAMLARDGITSEIYMPEPKRANILARIKGKNAGEPVVLLGHLDVVPARDEGWTEGPFSGAVRDGYLYGRGAIDMKSQVAAFLLAFLDLHRSGATPERDIVFLATADEETSGRLGVEYLLGKVKELRNTSFVLSEGGFILEKEGMLHARISVAEKMVCQFMLRAGAGRHGSMP